MRSLVITHLSPFRGLQENSGAYHRLRIFVQSIAEICDEIEILHFIDVASAQAVDQNSLTSPQADNWGTSVKISIGLRNQHRRWQMPIAPFSVKNDPRFSFLI